jgi:hypothetical protein
VPSGETEGKCRCQLQTNCMFIPFNFLLSVSQPNPLQSGSLANWNQITRLIHFQFSNTKNGFSWHVCPSWLVEFITGPIITKETTDYITYNNIHTHYDAAATNQYLVCTYMKRKHRPVRCSRWSCTGYDIN